MTDQPRPVTKQENRDAMRLALCAKSLHEDHVKRVTTLRARQEAYYKSLPKEPVEALREVSRALSDFNNMDGPGVAVRSAMVIINELALKRSLEDTPAVNDAVSWLTDHALRAICEIEHAVSHAQSVTSQFHKTHRPFEA